MKDKFLSKDGIADKYNFRGQCIEGIQNLGMGVGYIYSLCNMVPSFLSEQNLNDEYAGKVIGGFLAGTVSYFLGNYLHKINDNKKTKALGNIEEISFKGEKK